QPAVAAASGLVTRADGVPAVAAVADYLGVAAEAAVADDYRVAAVAAVAEETCLAAAATGADPHKLADGPGSATVATPAAVADPTGLPPHAAHGAGTRGGLACVVMAARACVPTGAPRGAGAAVADHARITARAAGAGLSTVTCNADGVVGGV